VAIQKCLLDQCAGLPHKGTPTCYGLKPMQDRMPRCARNDGHFELISVSLGSHGFVRFAVVFFHTGFRPPPTAVRNKPHPGALGCQASLRSRRSGALAAIFVPSQAPTPSARGRASVAVAALAALQPRPTPCGCSYIPPGVLNVASWIVELALRVLTVQSCPATLSPNPSKNIPDSSGLSPE
jgi:hypothetical protein